MHLHYLINFKKLIRSQELINPINFLDKDCITTDTHENKVSRYSTVTIFFYTGFICRFYCNFFIRTFLHYR